MLLLNFDEGSGSRVHDYSGQYNDGDITDATWVDSKSKFGKALSFNGTSAFVEIPHHSTLNITGDISVEALIKTTDTLGVIVAKLTNNPSNNGYRLYIEDGYLKFGVFLNGSEDKAQSSIQVNDGEWHYVVGIRTSSVVKVYIDGDEKGSTPSTIASIGQTTVNLGIGKALNWYAPDYFAGTIDEVRVMNGVLSAENITRNSEVGMGTVYLEDIGVLGLHLGHSKEVSSFELLLLNEDDKYGVSPFPIVEKDPINLYVGRGVNSPLLLMGTIEELEFVDDPIVKLLWLRGRCKGEELFRKHITAIYENQKGEYIVKDGIDNYTSLKHSRDGTELIEDTDTTYTLLDYKDFPLFDLIKYIRESADKVGAIGFTARIEYDGRFAFFPKGTKNAGFSLTDLAERSRYRVDIHRIMSWIKIYGAAEKADPTDKDIWTEGLDDAVLNDPDEFSHQEQTYLLAGTCVLNASPTGKKVALLEVKIDAKVYEASGYGYYKITYQKEGGTETDIVTDQAFLNTSYVTFAHTIYVLGDWEKTLTIRFYTKVEPAATAVYSKNHKAIYDRFNANWSCLSTGAIFISADVKEIGLVAVQYKIVQSDTWGDAKLEFSTPKDLNDYPSITFIFKETSIFKTFICIQLIDNSGYSALRFESVTNDEQANLINVRCGRKHADEWNVNVGFDWTQVKKVYVTAYRQSAGVGGEFAIDGFFFDHARFSYLATYPSAVVYPKEHIETIEELHSDNACEMRAKALLEYYKEKRREVRLESELLDWGANHIQGGDKITVPQILLHQVSDEDFTIESIDITVSPNRFLFTELALGKEPTLMADYLYETKRRMFELMRGSHAKIV